MPPCEQALRSVSWAPPEMTEGASDMAGRHLFMSVSHEGHMKMWDARCGFRHACLVMQGGWIACDDSHMLFLERFVATAASV